MTASHRYILGLLLLLGAPLLGEDSIVLHNGQRITGAVDVRGDMVYVRNAQGRTQGFARHLVRSIGRCAAPAPKTTARKAAPSPRSTTRNWRAAIERKLTKRYSVSFDKTPIHDVIGFLRVQTGLNFVVSPKIPPETTVTLTVDNMTLRNILQTIADITQLGFAPRNQALLMAPVEVIASHQTAVVLDVRDQMIAIIDRPRRPNVLGESAQQGNMGSSFGGSSGSPGGIARDARGRDLADVDLQTRGAQLTKMLAHITGPENWAASPAYIIPHLSKEDE